MKRCGTPSTKCSDQKVDDYVYMFHTSHIVDLLSLDQPSKESFRIGKVEKYCVTWAYRQKKKSSSMPYSQSALVLAYAKNVLGIPVPTKWNEKTLSHYPNFKPSRETTHRERFLKKPSVRKGFEKAFPGDQELAHAQYRKCYSSVNRALQNLAQKGLVRMSQNVGSVNLGGGLNKRMLQRRAGLNLSTFFQLTTIGRVVSRDILLGRECAPYESIIDAVGNEEDIYRNGVIDSWYDIEIYRENSPFGLLKALRAYMGLSLKEAHEATTRAPLLLMRVDNYDEAERICREVSALGACVKVREPVNGTFAFCFSLLHLQEMLGGSWANFSRHLGVSPAVVRKIRNREKLKPLVIEEIRANLEAKQLNDLLQHRILSVLA